MYLIIALLWFKKPPQNKCICAASKSRHPEQSPLVAVEPLIVIPGPRIVDDPGQAHISIETSHGSMDEALRYLTHSAFHSM